MIKLRIYEQSLNLTEEIYSLITKPPLNKDYALCDQIKRATISVPANISEGYQRTNKQYANYLQISSGSCNEVMTFLIIINRIYKIDTIKLQNEFESLAKQIYSLRNKLITNNSQPTAN